MKEKLEQIKIAAERELREINDLKLLEDVRVKFLGKKGELTQILRSMGEVAPEERPGMGQLVNDARSFLESMLEEAKTALNTKAKGERLKLEAIDVTMPGKQYEQGHRHPMTTVMDELKMIFIGMGFEIAEGPEIETDYYNFQALNIPANHSTRDEQDTFYTEGGFVLRTQTSPVQVRVMEQGKLPIRIIAPGRTFRSDEVDATHSPSFHQMEGLVIDKNITMGDLKGSLAVFAKELFGEDSRVRFRPHYFPFTEPSAEMDVSCFVCGGEGCRVCSYSGWIELLGCGMVHPKVLRMSGIDPDIYTGYAFGMGLERVAMSRFGISDLRLLYENDVKFLRQF